MPKIVIKINGEKLQYFDNLTLSTSIDAISSSLSFNTFYMINNYEFAKIEVVRNDIVIFTGKIIAPNFPNSAKPEPINYKCYSLTGELEDCTLPLDLYPIQTQNKSLKEIVESIVKSFDITVKFDASANSDINKKYTLQNQNPTDKASIIINKLCSQHDLILTNNSKGELLITKSIIGKQANFPIPIKNPKSYNYRKFYNSYLVLGQKSIKGGSSRKAVAKFTNVPENRNVSKIQKDGDSDSSIEQAKAMQYDSYKSNSMSVEFHNFFGNVGEIYDIAGVKMIANSINYNYNANSEICTVNLLNKKVYDR